MSSSSNSEAAENSALRASAGFSTRVMVCAVIVLSLVLIFIAILHVYARCFWRYSSVRSRRWARARHRRYRFMISEPSPPGLVQSAGLIKSLVDRLPTFVYNAQEREGAMDCAVCLCDFEDGDEGRTLPTCTHSFHTACIDTWFLSNSTCPLCRLEVGKDAEVSIPFDLDQAYRSNDSVFDPQGALAMAAAALSPRVSASNPNTPRVNCLTVNSNEDHRNAQINSEIAVRDAAEMVSSEGMSVVKQESVAMADKSKQTKSQGSSARLWAKKAPHVVIEVPRPSASCIPRAADHSPSQGTCKSPLSHLKSMKRLLVKEKKPSHPDLSAAEISQLSCRTPQAPPAAVHTPTKLHRSLPSSPSDQQGRI